ncbi:MAG: hypothetical protein ACHQ1G_07090 [Planctomycetota bacterium]
MRYLRIALGSVLVVALAGAAVIYLGRGAEGGSAPQPPPNLIQEEAHYYVLLDLVEVEPGDWDTNGSPPDLFYKIRWKGQEVFESATKEDTLVAKWSNASVRIGDVVKSVSIDDSIKAARITARNGDALEFAVYDADVGRDDLIGSWTVPVGTLVVGDQLCSRPGGRVVAARCRVLPTEGVDFEELTR